jgi:hypothetical protein
MKRGYLFEKTGLSGDEELNEKGKQGYCTDLNENVMVLHAICSQALSIKKNVLDGTILEAV